MSKFVRTWMCLSAILMVLLASSLAAQPVHAAAGDCIHLQTGLWNVASDWTCGHVPVAGDTVVIPQGANVILTGNHEVAELILGGNISGFSGQTITVTSIFEWDQGELNGAWALELPVGSQANATNAAIIRLSQATINNYGTFTLNNSAGLQASTGGSGGTINNYGSFLINQGSSVWHNFNNYAGAALTVQAAPDPAPSILLGPLTNAGSIDILSGMLELSQGSAQTGVVNIATGATMSFTNAPNNNLNPGFQVTGDGAIGIYGGNMTLYTSVNLPRLALTGSSAWINGQGRPLYVAKSFYWNGGSVNNTLVYLQTDCITTLAESPDPMYLNSSSVLRNAGTLTLERAGGLSYLYGSSSIENVGRFKIKKGSIRIETFTNGPTGVIEVDVQAGNTAALEALFPDQGATFIKSGTFRLNGVNGTNLNGDITISPAATLELGTGSRMFYNDATITGPGTLLVSDGNNNLNWPAIFTIGTFKQTAGISYVRNMSLTGDLIIEGGNFDASETPGTITFHAGSGFTQKLTAKVPAAFTDIEVIGNTVVNETETANNINLTGELINYGTVKKMLPVSGAGKYTFGLTGAVIDLTAPGSLTTLTVSRKSPDIDLGVAQSWSVVSSPLSASGYTANLTLPHHLVPESARACKYSGAGTDWTCRTDAHATNSVTMNALTDLTSQPFAVMGPDQTVDLALNMTADYNSVSLGQALPITLTLTNLGNTPASNVEVVNHIPAGVELVSAEATQGICTQTGPTPVCDIGTVDVMTIPAASNFEGLLPAETQGWSVDANATNLKSVGAGGYFHGYLSANGAAGANWYFYAADAYLNNRSDAYGGRLSFFLKQSALTNQFDAADVVLQGGGLTLTFDTPYNPSTDWTYYQVPLQAGAGWVNQATGQAATEAQIRAALASATSLAIRGSYSSDVNTGMLDLVILEQPAAPVTITLTVRPAQPGSATVTANAITSSSESDINNNQAFFNFNVLTGLFIPLVTR